MKLTKMLRVSATALGCLLALISCRQEPDAASGPLAPVDVKVVNHLVAVLGHERCVLELVDPASGEKVKSIRLAQPPNGMAVDGATAYVAEGGPRSVASDGNNVYVAGYFSDSLAEISLKDACKSRAIPLNGQFRPSREKLGERYFNDASHCFQGWQSCATCHPDGRVDGLNWDLLNDGMGNPKNTRTMFLSHRTSPVMTLGVRASAEVAVTAGFVHIQFLEPSGELAECVNAYLKNMKEVPSPFLVAHTPSKQQTGGEGCAQCHAPGVERGALSESARRGREVFKTAGCVRCHPHPYFTNKELVATGTATGLDEGKSVLVPSLVEVWRTAPYLHDGRAKTIREAITTCNPGDLRGKTSSLNNRELEDLINYVQSL